MDWNQLIEQLGGGLSAIVIAVRKPSTFIASTKILYRRPRAIRQFNRVRAGYETTLHPVRAPQRYAVNYCRWIFESGR